jgi:8-hydroxy-5-deazaflavin:NADPH oxidoreductase
VNIGILGTGMVGKTIASKLVELGHEVRMGSRAAGNESAVAWAAEAGEGASTGTFADAAGFGEVVFNCTAGVASLDALAAAGETNLAGKLLIDVANPLDFSQGMPPSLSVCNTDSLGERIQRAFPATHVVKALNTVNCDVMVEPARVPGEHVVFVCGNDFEARGAATRLLGEFGWPAERVLDLGDVTAARGTEMYLPLWLNLMGQLGTLHFNIELTREVESVDRQGA